MTSFLILTSLLSNFNCNDFIEKFEREEDKALALCAGLTEIGKEKCLENYDYTSLPRLKSIRWKGTLQSIKPGKNIVYQVIKGKVSYFHDLKVIIRINDDTTVQFIGADNDNRLIMTKPGKQLLVVGKVESVEILEYHTSCNIILSDKKVIRVKKVKKRQGKKT